METRVKAINISLSFFVYYRILLFENSIVIYESEIFLDIPVRARKVFCLGIIYRTKGIEEGGEGFCKRSNKCMEAWHVRFLPRTVFYYFMGRGREKLHKGVGFHRMKIQRGSHFPCKSNL